MLSLGILSSLIHHAFDILNFFYGNQHLYLLSKNISIKWSSQRGKEIIKTCKLMKTNGNDWSPNRIYRIPLYVIVGTTVLVLYL